MFKFRYLRLKLNPTFISGKSQSHFCILNKFTSITHTEYRPKAVPHSQLPNKNPLNFSPLWPQDCPRHEDAALFLPSLLGNLCNPSLKQRLYERWAASREMSLYVSLHKAFGISCVPTDQPLTWTAPNHQEGHLVPPFLQSNAGESLAEGSTCSVDSHGASDHCQLLSPQVG